MEETNDPVDWHFRIRKDIYHQRNGQLLLSGKEEDTFFFQVIGSIKLTRESGYVVIYYLDDVEGLFLETSLTLTIINTPSYVEEDPEKSEKTTERSSEVL